MEPFSQRSPRVVAARRLLRRRHRDETGLFLAEGPQAVREAIAAGQAHEIYFISDGYARHRELLTAAERAELSIWPITESGLTSLTETVTPQGVVAVCRQWHHDRVADVLADQPRLVVVLAGISDPGNAGTVLRTADAAGADAVVFPDGSVDPYNGKCVRASAGSLFHVDLVRGGAAAETVAAVRAAGLTVLAADAHAAADLDDLVDRGDLAGRTAWLFGSEAHGLPAGLAAQADLRVRVPIHGRAESLNLAAAAAVCLYASARAHRRAGAPQ
ncbi:MAG TPA: RNA methyltransferase [Micromonosporaceae bacterium]